MLTYQALGIELTEQERSGILEKHHIVFRSQGGTDYELNIILLPSAFHKGKNGAHGSKSMDLKLKKAMQEELYKLFQEEQYTKEQIIKNICPWNKKSKEKIEKQFRNTKNNMGSYKREDIVRTLMGGKLC